MHQAFVPAQKALLVWRHRSGPHEPFDFEEPPFGRAYHKVMLIGKSQDGASLARGSFGDGREVDMRGDIDFAGTL